VAKLRVYELAKEFGVESRVVMIELENMGEFVRSASSTVEAPVVAELRDRLARKSATGKRASSATASPGGARTPTGTLASDEALAALRFKLSGGSSGAGDAGPGGLRPETSSSGPAPRPGPRPGPPPPGPRPRPGGALPRPMPPLPPMPVDGRLRRVLSVSVGSVAAESGAESGKLEPLPFAASQSAALAKALASLGYHGKPALTSDSAEDIGRSVGAAISGADRDDVLVVHILGHGELGETGSVYVVGADGKTHPLTDIEHWLKMVEDFPGAAVHAIPARPVPQRCRCPAPLAARQR
jgi:hypothetical protein